MKVNMFYYVQFFSADTSDQDKSQFNISDVSKYNIEFLFEFSHQISTTIVSHKKRSEQILHLALNFVCRKRDPF